MDEFLQNEQVVMTAEDKKKFWDTLCELKGEADPYPYLLP